jgi:signal transduction histidine kinase
MLEIQEIRAPMAALDTRGPALRRLLRRLRHDSATPLSGALLHLEIAARRLGSEGDARRQAAESVEEARTAIDRGSVLVELLDRMILIAEEELVMLDLREVFPDAAAAASARARERGLAIAPLDPGPPARIIVGRRALESTLERLVALWIETASAPDRLDWRVAATECEVLLSARWLGELESAVRDRSAAATLAEWALEAQGSRLEIEQHDATILATARFVRAQV